MDEAVEFYTAREVAVLFGVSFKSVTRWAGENRIPHIKTPGGHYRYPKSQIDKLRQELET